MKQQYFDTIVLIERLHRQFLEVVKGGLDRLGVEDINNVQSMILYNVGGEELTVGELTYRGVYLGSNVSYNVKKMVDHGYLVQERSTHDRRSARVRVSEKGLDLCKKIAVLYDRHVGQLEKSSLKASELDAVIVSLRQLERLWATNLANNQRPQTQISQAVSAA